MKRVYSVGSFWVNAGVRSEARDLKADPNDAMIVQN